MSDIGEEVETIEVDLLLEGIFRRYGYDFRNYARMSVRRRLLQFLPAVRRQAHQLRHRCRRLR